MRFTPRRDEARAARWRAIGQWTGETQHDLLERATASPLGPKSAPPVPKPSASVPSARPKVSLQASTDVRPQPGQ